VTVYSLHRRGTCSGRRTTTTSPTVKLLAWTQVGIKLTQVRMKYQIHHYETPLRSWTKNVVPLSGAVAAEPCCTSAKATTVLPLLLRLFGACGRCTSDRGGSLARNRSLDKADLNNHPPPRKTTLLYNRPSPDPHNKDTLCMRISAGESFAPPPSRTRATTSCIPRIQTLRVKRWPDGSPHCRRTSRGRCLYLKVGDSTSLRTDSCG